MSRDKAPSFQFYPRDFLADPSVALLSFDETGRYVIALCRSFQTETPGVAPEDAWREWMQYTKPQWKIHREKLAKCFVVQSCGTEYLWIQKRMRDDREAQLERFIHASQRGMKGAEKRWKRDA